MQESQQREGFVRSFLTRSWIPTTLKYVSALVLALYAFVRVQNQQALFFSLVELLLVFLACNALASKSRVTATLVSSLLLLAYDIQQLLLVFANSFLSLIMITNLDSLEDISGKATVYGGAIVAMLLILLLPVRHFRIPLPSRLEQTGGLALVLFVLASVEAVGLELVGIQSSPFFGYAALASQHAETAAAVEEIKQQPNTTLEFYHADVPDYVAKPATLPERPNVVVIFTEGLSQHIVNDEREIMPNVARYQRESQTFTNYYNHTFATYRGLIGQMYSGFQRENQDENSLVSFARIFSEQGYRTAFINSEPSNQTFLTYLHFLGYDEVLDYPDEEHYGNVAGTLADRESYEKLFDTISAYHSPDTPFLIGIYTLGTHASLDSTNEVFGNGYDSELNKFYDADYQFGEFMDKFVNSPLFEDTIIVFTTDHCTYGDMYFTDAFPSYERANVEVDSIPLFIFHKGVVPGNKDVDGRNSLALAPTILDYLDMSAENYFLGTSLYAPNSAASEFETCFTDGGGTQLTTKNGRVHDYTQKKKNEMKKLLWRYYAAKQQEPLTPDMVEQEPSSL